MKNDLRNWMRLVESLPPNAAVQQMIALLSADTRVDSDAAVRRIAALKDQIPPEYRNAPRILWRSAGLTLDAAKQFLAGQSVPSMSRPIASWARQKEQAAVFCNAQAHPVVLYRASVEPTKIIFNTEFDTTNDIANMLAEVIVEMDQRLAMVSFVNVAAMGVTNAQYEALTGQTETPTQYGLILRFSGGKIARVDPGPSYNVFRSIENRRSG